MSGVQYPSVCVPICAFAGAVGLSRRARAPPALFGFFFRPVFFSRPRTYRQVLVNKISVSGVQYRSVSVPICACAGVVDLSRRAPAPPAPLRFFFRLVFFARSRTHHQGRASEILVYLSQYPSVCVPICALAGVVTSRPTTPLPPKQLRRLERLARRVSVPVAQPFCMQCIV